MCEKAANVERKTLRRSGELLLKTTLKDSVKDCDSLETKPKETKKVS